MAHGLKTQNLFPSIGANGPATVHVNFGQMGFVFIEANVKKWGLAPMTGSLAPPPPYGSEQGSILLEAGRDGGQTSGGAFFAAGHSRSRSGVTRARPAGSPGPVRSPTDISLAQLEHVPSNEDMGGEPSSSSQRNGHQAVGGLGIDTFTPSAEPPEYSSPQTSNGDDENPLNGSGSQGRIRPSRPPIPSYESATALSTTSHHSAR